MKQLGYYIIKYWISFGLFCYYKKIKIVGLQHIPKNKPLLFLSNHQNALMDVLLIATRCNRKPWFLTRADVFKSKFTRRLFHFLQMMPVYRIRDGRDNLAKNKAIFDACGQLLRNSEAILLFPEANHNLKRRVRPLSKGFTRIVENALQKRPNLDLQIIPVGQNYNNGTGFGDSAALYYGKPIAVQPLIDQKNSIEKIKTEVFDSLTSLTTHIPEEANYEKTISKLDALLVDYLNPKIVNELIASDFGSNLSTKTKKKRYALPFRYLFYLFNFPVVLIWKLMVKQRVPEPEFTATFRFGFALLSYPIFYSVLILVLAQFMTVEIAILFVLGHFLVNFAIVKVFPT